MKRIKYLVIWISTLLITSVMVLPAYAITFTVDTTTDDSTAAYQACTVAPDDCSLRGAILTANATAGADVIDLPENLYELTIVGGDDAALLGDLDITDDLTVMGGGAGATVDATLLTNGDRSFEITGGGNIIVEFDNLIISGGESIPGAGIYVETGRVTIRNSTLTDNDAMSNGGGAIYNEARINIINTSVSNNHSGVNFRGAGIYNSESAVLRMVDSTIENNTAGYGAGLYNEGEATLTRTSVLGNIAETGEGGGIQNGNILRVVNSNISDNQTLSTSPYPIGGGGIWSQGQTGANHKLAITGSTISNNEALQSAAGGVYSGWDGELLIQNTTISDNTANDTGGIITNSESDLINVSVLRNTSNLDGGGLSAYEQSPITISDSTFSENAAGDDGGALNIYSSTTKIIDSLISSNTAISQGAGIYYLDNSAVPGSLSISGSKINSNSTTGGGGLGGGIYAYGGFLTIKKSVVNLNSADSEGGGIRTTDTLVSIFESTLGGNTTQGDGGALYNEIDLDPSIVSINNSTISGNEAVGHGGGLVNEFSPVAGGSAEIHLFNVTIANNLAGGPSDGIFNDGGLVVARNTVVGQQITAGADCRTVGGGVTNGVGPNLEEGTSCGFLINSIFPGLDPLALNAPGTSPTHALQAGSPAIDAGNPAGCRGDSNTDGTPDILLPTDQRGIARNLFCDLGAYEF